MAEKSFEFLTFTQEEQDEINALVCLLWTKFKGKLKNITIQDQRGFINYGKRQEKIVVNLVESNCIVVDKVTLNEDNSVCCHVYLLILIFWVSI